MNELSDSESRRKIVLLSTIANSKTLRRKAIRGHVEAISIFLVRYESAANSCLTSEQSQESGLA